MANQPNPVRNCIACGQVDDHPRHVIDVGDGREMAFHMDCHSRMNPPCQICADQIADAPVGTIGEDLRAHLVSLPPRVL